MHQRYYSNQLGRFVSVDPIGGSVGSSQSWNRYSYVLNNPIKFIDPKGLTWKITTDNLEDQKKMLSQMEEKTGLILEAVDGEVNIKGIRAGEDGKAAGSAAARSLVVDAVTSDKTFTLNIVRGDKAVMAGSSSNFSNNMSLDMADIDSQRSADGIDLRTFDASMTVLHEMFHNVRGTGDPGPFDPPVAGQTVGAMNAIRRTLGLDPRTRYQPLSVMGNERDYEFQSGIISVTNQ